MSGWTATECARRRRAPAGFESEEDEVGGRKAREEVSSLPVIVGGGLGLLLADSASATIASFTEENVMSDRSCHGYGRGSPGHFFSCRAPRIPLTHRPNG
jgi:hypothetical protein